MRNFSFDDGYESFSINGDENRVIRFNPSDPNLMIRYNESVKNINEAKKKIGSNVKLRPDGTSAETDQEKREMACAVMQEVESTIKENINYMFNSDVYDTVFAGQSPFCMVGNGRYLLEAFLYAVKPVMESAIRKSNEQSERRMDKYLSGYKKGRKR